MSTGLVWFRNDLRIADNKSLAKACRNHKKVIAVYFLDPRHYEKSAFGFPKTGKFRAKFLIESIRDLQHNLSCLNIPLLCFFEKPEDRIEQLRHEYHIENIYYQKEWTQEEKDVENAVRKTSTSLEYHSYYNQFLYHPEEIPFEFSEIPEVFTEFRKACEKKAEIREVLQVPAPLSKGNLLDVENTIPGLEDLGFEEFETDERTAFPFKGGETKAIKRLKHYFWKTENLAEYKKTRNGLIGKNYSSKLSAWLANGCISPRQIYHEIKRFEQEVTSNQSTYWLIFELIWRDFFKYISLKHGNKIFSLSGIKDKDLEWSTEVQKLKDWIDGKTEYDFVNANMKEIAATGFMSNRGRQNVNSFLAKEVLYDWRYGAAYFEAMLIDYDVHSNWGNWMYNSGVGNDPRDRKFNIASQAERYDPNQEYQKLWLKNQRP